MNVLNIISFQNDLSQTKRQNVLKLVPKNTSPVTEIRILTRPGCFRCSDEAFSDEVKVEALEAGVVGEQAGQVEVLGSAVDAEFEVTKIRHHAQWAGLKRNWFNICEKLINQSEKVY